MLLVWCLMMPSEGKADPVFTELYDAVACFTAKVAQKISTAMTARMPSVVLDKLKYLL